MWLVMMCYREVLFVSAEFQNSLLILNYHIHCYSPVIYQSPGRFDLCLASYRYMRLEWEKHRDRGYLVTGFTGNRSEKHGVPSIQTTMMFSSTWNSHVNVSWILAHLSHQLQEDFLKYKNANVFPVTYLHTALIHMNSLKYRYNCSES